MSNYPERPPALRPKKPHKGKGRPSSEHISGKRRVFYVKAVAAEPGFQQRPSYDKLAANLCVFGHTNPAAERFFKTYRHNRVPLHVWGKKGRAEVSA